MAFASRNEVEALREKQRQDVVDGWFGGDTEAAEDVFNALPYSTIPDYFDLAEVMRALSSWARKEKAAAWQEGHITQVERGPDDCTCNAWNEDECGCGLYGTGPVLTSNPYEEPQ